MPTFRTPLVGSYNQRSFNTSTTLDQKFKGCIISRVVNQALNSATYYLEKRCAFANQVTVSAGATGYGCYFSPGLNSVIVGLGSPSTMYQIELPSTIYNRGAITGTPLHFSEVIFSTVTFIMITSSDQTGWFMSSAATGGNFTGNTSSGTATISNIADTSGFYIGQKLTGPGIHASARVLTIPGGTSITMTHNASTSETGATFNHEFIAKIIDADFPTNIVGPFVDLNGYVHIMSADGKVYMSDLNTVITWTSGNWIAANRKSDAGRGLAKYKEQIVAFGSGSVEFFYNAGNTSGSVLSQAQGFISTIGASASLTANRLLAASLNDTVYWIGQDQCLYQLDGATSKKLPTTGVAFGNQIAIDTLYPIHFNGVNYIHVGFNNYLYDTWYCIDTGNFVQPGFPANVHITCRDSITPEVLFVLQSASGILQVLDTTSFADASGTLTMSIQLATDMGTENRKFGTCLRVLADNQASGNLSVSYSDDDGATFSTVRTISLTRMVKELRRLGSWFGTRIWKFTDAGNNANRIKQIEIDYEVNR